MNKNLPGLECIGWWLRTLHPSRSESIRIKGWVVFRDREDTDLEHLRVCIKKSKIPKTLMTVGGPDTQPIFHISTSNIHYEMPLYKCDEIYFRTAIVATHAYWKEKPRIETTHELQQWFSHVHNMIYGYIDINVSPAQQESIVRFGRLVKDMYEEFDDAQFHEAILNIRREIQNFAHRISEDDLITLYRESTIQRILKE